MWRLFLDLHFAGDTVCLLSVADIKCANDRCGIVFNFDVHSFGLEN